MFVGVNFLKTLSSEGYGLADRHDRQLADQHRCGRPHVLLLQLEAHTAHPLLLALPRPVGGLPGQDANGFCQRGQGGHGSSRTGQTPTIAKRPTDPH